MARFYKTKEGKFLDYVLEPNLDLLGKVTQQEVATDASKKQFMAETPDIEIDDWEAYDGEATARIKEHYTSRVNELTQKLVDDPNNAEKFLSEMGALKNDLRRNFDSGEIAGIQMTARNHRAQMKKLAALKNPDDRAAYQKALIDDVLKANNALEGPRGSAHKIYKEQEVFDKVRYIEEIAGSDSFKALSPEEQSLYYDVIDGGKFSTSHLTETQKLTADKISRIFKTWTKEHIGEEYMGSRNAVLGEKFKDENNQLDFTSRDSVLYNALEGVKEFEVDNEKIVNTKKYDELFLINTKARLDAIARARAGTSQDTQTAVGFEGEQILAHSDYLQNEENKLIEVARNGFMKYLHGKEVANGLTVRGGVKRTVNQALIEEFNQNPREWILKNLPVGSKHYNNMKSIENQVNKNYLVSMDLAAKVFGNLDTAKKYFKDVEDNFVNAEWIVGYDGIGEEVDKYELDANGKRIPIGKKDVNGNPLYKEIPKIRFDTLREDQKVQDYLGLTGVTDFKLRPKSMSLMVINEKNPSDNFFRALIDITGPGSKELGSTIMVDEEGKAVQAISEDGTTLLYEPSYQKDGAGEYVYDSNGRRIMEMELNDAGEKVPVYTNIPVYQYYPTTVTKAIFVQAKEFMHSNVSATPNETTKKTPVSPNPYGNPKGAIEMEKMEKRRIESDPLYGIVERNKTEFKGKFYDPSTGKIKDSRIQEGDLEEEYYDFETDSQ